MARCFCGCGRKVSLVRWGLNKQGERTSELVEQLKAAKPTAESDGAAGGIAALDELIGEGQGFEEFWAATIHDSYVPPSRDLVDDTKERWTAWGERGAGTVAFYAQEPEERAAMVKGRGDP